MECSNVHNALLHKKKLVESFQLALDEVVDEELHFYLLQKKSNGMGSYVRGIYYLTLAKFLNPTAYHMAWRVIDKLEDKKVYCEKDSCTLETKEF